jgi:hypothetical protein
VFFTAGRITLSCFEQENFYLVKSRVFLKSVFYSWKEKTFETRKFLPCKIKGVSKKCFLQLEGENFRNRLKP